MKLRSVGCILMCFAVCRLVKTQVEVEMEVDQNAEELQGADADFLPQEPIITIEEEEEVVLFWDSGSKSKGAWL